VQTTRVNDSQKESLFYHPMTHVLSHHAEILIVWGKETQSQTDLGLGCILSTEHLCWLEKMA
jgi:hypothetical protein